MAVKQHIKLRYKSIADREVIENLCRLTRMDINEFASKAIQKYAQELIDRVENEQARLREEAARRNGSVVNGDGPSDSTGITAGEPQVVDSPVLANTGTVGTEA